MGFTNGSTYFFQAYQTENGPDLNTITAIVQGPKGYLWLGTYNGLIRFDGVRYVTFNSQNTPDLADDRITALYEDNRGEIWIGHETGALTRYANGVFKSIKLPSAYPGGDIVRIGEDNQGDLWLLNDGGSLIRLKDGKLLRGGTDKTNCVVTWMAQGIHKNGRLWVVSSGVVGIVQNGQFVPYHFNGLRQNNLVCEEVLPSRGDGLWVVCKSTIRKWRNGQWVLNLPWSAGNATALLEARSGSLCVGTLNDGLYVYKANGNCLHYTRTNGLSFSWVRSLYEDREGDVWIGTGGGGLDAMRVRTIKMLQVPDNRQGWPVSSLVTYGNGSAWIGTEGAGLYSYHAESWEHFGATNGLGSSFIWSVLRTREGQLFVGTWGDGIFVKHGDRFETPVALRKITAPILALFEDHNGVVWIGTTIGLYRYEAGKAVLVAGKANLGVPDVRTITESSDGTLWFGMAGGGLGCLRNGKLRQYKKSNGLNSDFVFALYADRDGTLWIGTADGGLCRLKNGKFATIGLRQGLSDNGIFQIVNDGSGGLWMGSQHGILYARMADLNKCANGVIKRIRCVSFGLENGMASERCSAGFAPGACRTAGGQIWFPTAKGIAIVDPARLSLNSRPPTVLIENFAVDGRQIELPTGRQKESAKNSHFLIRIPPGRRNYQFRYTGLSFADPNKVRFKYKLSGLEKSWEDAGEERTVQYSYLPPGTYAFHVIACNDDGVWNKDGASIVFTILPFFWETWWFESLLIAAGAVSVGGAAWYMARWRGRRKLERMERQTAVERERTRIARDIHDDLGTSLTRITMLSQVLRRKIVNEPEALAVLSQIGSGAKELTRVMDEIVWAVNPKHDTLESLVAYLGGFAQNFLGAAGIRCCLDVPIFVPDRTLTAELRHNVFLAFKEALHNVVKHAKAAEVRISLELQPDRFVLVIADDGCGCDSKPSGERSSACAGDGRLSAGNGLLNMKRRLERFGGCCEWNSLSGCGTQVKFIVGIKHG